MLSSFDHCQKQAETRQSALVEDWARAHPEQSAAAAFAQVLQAIRRGVEGRSPHETGPSPAAAALPFSLLLDAVAREFGRADQQRDFSLARLHRTVLQTLDPAQAMPIPSCAIFRLDPAPGTPPGFAIAAGSFVRPGVGNTALSGDATSVCYQLAHDVKFWPIDVVHARLERTDDHYELRLTLRTKGVRFDQLGGLDRLTLFLHDPLDRANPLDRPFRLYESLVTATSVTALGATAVPLEVTPRGFGARECLLPDEPRCLSSTRLLQEFAVVPERFLFVDIAGLSQAQTKGKDELEIVARLAGTWSTLNGVHAGNFLLQCAPAINASSLHHVCVNVPAHRFEHAINPNSTGHGPLEVIDVLEVEELRAAGSATPRTVIPPFAAQRHVYADKPAPWFHLWRDSKGVCQLRLVSAEGKPLAPGTGPKAVIVAIRMYHGDAAVGPEHLWTCGDHPARAVINPTPALRPVATTTLAERAALLSLGLSRESAAAFRNRLLALLELRAWAPAAATQSLDGQRRAWMQRLVLGVKDLLIDDDDGEVSPLDLAGVSRAVWVPGRRCTVAVDPEQFPGQSIFLFGQLLDRALAERASANRFTRLVVRGTGEAHHWMPRFSLSQGVVPQWDRKERIA